MADLIRWRPFHSLMRDFFNDISPTFHNHHHIHQRDDIDFVPSLDLRQDEKGIEVTVDIPGMEKKNIDMFVEDDILVIRGEKEENKRGEAEGYIHTERSYGRFERRVYLPKGVEEDNLKAELKNGVLKLTAPVKTVSKPAGKKIAIL